MKEMKASGFQTRDIRKLDEERRVVKVKPGLYRLADIQLSEDNGLVEVCLAMPKAVICLISALAYHDLTTFVPTTITFAIPRWQKPIKLTYPPSQPYYFSGEQYKGGIELRETKVGHVRIYVPEKTICDCSRFRNKLGEDLALEALQQYLKRRNRDLNKLMKFAELCRVRGVIELCLKAALASH